MLHHAAYIDKYTGYHKGKPLSIAVWYLWCNATRWENIFILALKGQCRHYGLVFCFVIIVNMPNVTTKKTRWCCVSYFSVCLTNSRFCVQRKVPGRGLLLDLGGTHSIMLTLFSNPLFKALCFHLLCLTCRCCRAHLVVKSPAFSASRVILSPGTEKSLFKLACT